jgi:hypothetical protein
MPRGGAPGVVSRPSGHVASGLMGLNSGARPPDWASCAASGASGSDVVIVDEAAEDGPAPDLRGVLRPCRGGGERHRGPLVPALVWPPVVGVGRVVSQHPPQVRLVDDERVIQALRADGADDPLRDGVLLACQPHPVRPLSKRSSRSRTPSIPGTGDASPCSTIGTTGGNTESGSSTTRSACGHSRRSGRASRQWTPSSAVPGGGPPSIRPNCADWSPYSRASRPHRSQRSADAPAVKAITPCVSRGLCRIWRGYHCKYRRYCHAYNRND